MDPELTTFLDPGLDPDLLFDDMLVTRTETLDRLPVGTVAVDKDGYTLVRISENEWFTADGSGPNYWGHDEVRGDYAEPGVSPFLPLHNIRLPY